MMVSIDEWCAAIGTGWVTGCFSVSVCNVNSS